MSFLNKRVEESIKQAKLLAQMSEMSHRSLNGTRQTRSSFTNNDLKEQADTDKPAVGNLSSEMIAQYKREEEEQNKYVNPTTGNEFQYAPAGTAHRLKKRRTMTWAISYRLRLRHRRRSKICARRPNGRGLSAFGRLLSAVIKDYVRKSAQTQGLFRVAGELRT